MTERAAAPAAVSPRMRMVLAVTVAWLAGRGLVLWLLLDRHAWVTGDVDYFATSLAAVPDAGLAETLVEYPLPGVVVVAFPWLLVGLLGIPDAYAEAVLALSMLADAAFTALLVWISRGCTSGLAIWLFAVPALGATAYARFDLVPGLLTGAALLLLGRRPRLAAAAAALASAFKLWPALVLPALAAPPASRRRVVGVVVAVGVVLAGASVAVAGWARLVSPLAWQGERGLQIESVAATPAMLGWVVSREGYEVAYTEHNAFEITGRGVHALLLTSEVATLLLVPLLGWLWGLAWRRGERLSTETVVWVALVAVGAFMAAGKVLSPQYLLWLLPLAAAGTAVTGSRGLRTWSVLLLVATAATQMVFPELYGHVIRLGDRSVWAVLVLAARNTLLLGLVAWAAVAAVRGVSAAARSRAIPPDPTERAFAPSGDAPTTPS